MKATRTSQIPCLEWTGESRLYQVRAADALTDYGAEPSHFAWITPTCGTLLCIEPSHLVVHAPVRLAYPSRICVYCGRHAGTRDHLLPRRWSGDAQRHFVATVPACGTCNNVLSDTLTWSITERRAICHARLRKHFAKVLKTVDFTAEELDEFGHRLRQHVEDAMSKKAEVLRMLAWPEDPNYDQRALERSGIEDPFAIGLILSDDADLDEYVRNAVRPGRPPVGDQETTKE